MMQREKDEAVFKQALLDKARRAVDTYTPYFTKFLDGRSLKTAEELLCGFGDEITAVSYGGFANAERVCIGMFPSAVYGYTENVSELYDMFGISAIKITGSGFSYFDHRDVLGSILGLGVKRETIGDIYLPDEKTAFVCLTSVAASCTVDGLEFVSKDKVKVTEISLEALPVCERKFVVISGTVASERLDCIVALCTGKSREKVKDLIVGGGVSLNHFEENRADTPVCVGDVISVRGVGRFVLKEHGFLTKKGRLKTIVHKMI